MKKLMIAAGLAAAQAVVLVVLTDRAYDAGVADGRAESLGTDVDPDCGCGVQLRVVAP